MSESKERLDLLLVALGLAESRARARMLIDEGRVRIDGDTADKASRLVSRSSLFEVTEPPRFVSRGGLKLLAAIEQFEVSFQDCSVLDVGASTGGFTDCALQHGAASVICVDVGRDQLHSKLRSDPRVTNLESTNARSLVATELPAVDFDRIVMDLSFISITLVLPAVWPLLRSDGVMIALVKPQFEAGRHAVSQGKGIIRDDQIRHESLQAVLSFCRASLPDCCDPQTIPCPIHGSDGNREFLMLLKKQRSPGLGDILLRPERQSCWPSECEN